jgi:hypothetical protein
VNGRWLWLYHDLIPCFPQIGGLSAGTDNFQTPRLPPSLPRFMSFLAQCPRGSVARLGPNPGLAYRVNFVLHQCQMVLQCHFKSHSAAGSVMTSKQRIQKPGNKVGKRADQITIPRQSYLVRHMSHGGDKKMWWGVSGRDRPVTSLQPMMNLDVFVGYERSRWMSVPKEVDRTIQ